MLRESVVKLPVNDVYSHNHGLGREEGLLQSLDRVLELALPLALLCGRSLRCTDNLTCLRAPPHVTPINFNLAGVFYTMS